MHIEIANFPDVVTFLRYQNTRANRKQNMFFKKYSISILFNL